MSTLHQGTRMSVAVRHMAWTFVVLLPLTGWTAADGATAVPYPADDSPVAKPEVWLCAGDRIMELLQPGAEWPFVKQHLSGFKLYIGQLYGKRSETNAQTIERLQPLARFVRAHHLQVAVELGGCLDFSPMDDTAGEWSAQYRTGGAGQLLCGGWPSGLPRSRWPHPSPAASRKSTRRPAVRFDRQGRRRIGRRAEAASGSSSGDQVLAADQLSQLGLARRRVVSLRAGRSVRTTATMTRSCGSSWKSSALPASRWTV